MSLCLQPVFEGIRIRLVPLQQYDNDNDNNNDNDDRNLRPSEMGNFWGMTESLEFVWKELRADKWQAAAATAATTTAIVGAIGSSSLPAATRQPAPPPVFVLGFSRGAVLVHKIAMLACCLRKRRSRSKIIDTNFNTDGLCYDNSEDNNDIDSRSVWSNVRKCILVSGFSFTASIGKSSSPLSFYDNKGYSTTNHCTPK